ncbi:hypothetical protein HN011_009883 [Eciton burchellii]|nr:hypothetical protein HN011_009883 [Eciton burchellii]
MYKNPKELGKSVYGTLTRALLVLEKNTCRGPDCVLALHFSAELRQRKTEGQRGNRVARSEQTIEGNALADYRGERKKEGPPADKREEEEERTYLSKRGKASLSPPVASWIANTGTSLAMCLFAFRGGKAGRRIFHAAPCDYHEENSVPYSQADDHSIIPTKFSKLHSSSFSAANVQADCLPSTYLAGILEDQDLELGLQLPALLRSDESCYRGPVRVTEPGINNRRENYVIIRTIEITTASVQVSFPPLVARVGELSARIRSMSDASNLRQKRGTRIDIDVTISSSRYRRGGGRRTGGRSVLARVTRASKRSVDIDALKPRNLVDMRYFTLAPDLSCVRNFSNYGYYTGSRAVNGKAVADRLERVINDDALSVRLRGQSRTISGEARISNISRY